MGMRDYMGAGVVQLAVSSLTIAANATTAFNFGSPADIKLGTTTASAPGLGYVSGMRLLLVMSAVRAAGTTSKLTYTVQDADDAAGSIGTPATALTDGTALVAALGTQYHTIGIQTQSGRPWLRVNAVHSNGGTDSYQCHAVLLGIPGGL